MVTHVDSSVYFFSLLASSGLLYGVYKFAISKYDDYRDGIIRDLRGIVSRQNSVIGELEKEISVRSILNSPIFIEAFKSQFDDIVRSVPENGSDASNDEDTTVKSE